MFRLGTAQVLPPDNLPEPHLWLPRPFSPEYRQWIESTFPYGSTANGRYVLHTGCDILNPLGTPLLAMGDGEVAYAGNDSAQVYGPWPDYYGNLIILRLDRHYGDQPIFVLYGHVSETYVKTGQAVHTGDVIGAVGMTGIATGPHLHLEVRIGENSYYATRNPEFWLRPLPGDGVLAGRLLDAAGQPLPDQRILVYKQARPGSVWRVVPTYLAEPEINHDDAWGENFILGDVPAGEYRLEVVNDDALARTPITIEPGRITFVEIKLPIGED